MNTRLATRTQRRSLPSRRATLAGPLALLLLAGSAGAHAQETSIELVGVAPRGIGVDAFRLDRPATLVIDATGGGPDALNRVARARDAVIRFVGRVIDIGPPDADGTWAANAWIVDAATREVVWRLDDAETTARNRLRRFEGEVQLPAGTYEVYYANFPQVGWNNSRPGWQYDHDAARDLGIRIGVARGSFSRLTPEIAREPFGAAAVITLGRDNDRTFDRIGFDLDREVTVDVYVVGEASRSRNYDHGWILDVDTREVVWRFDHARSQPAGGTVRNRVARERVSLRPGRYAAFFERDRSHGPGSWRAAPPLDPAFGGMTLRVADPADRDAFRTYPYEPVPVREAIVALVRLGDDETVSEGFTLSEPLDVRVFAVGEGRQDAMFDRGWILDAATRQPVWTMEFENTVHAGGSSRNRMFDGVVRLEPGSYIVNFRTDGSHAWDDWNSPAPMDADFWGITLVPAAGTLDRDIVKPYDEASDPSIIARIVQVRDGQQVRRRFTLDDDTDVRVYAIGEGQSGQMFDYARIVDERGHEIWRMQYDLTERAGGSRKNRQFNGVVRLPAGAYEVIYRTDDSHAFGRWNASPPTDPRAWGVTLRRES